MPTWGLKYQTQYTTQSDANNAEKTHTLQFLYKEYLGTPISVTGADVTAIQKCTVDEACPQIKGSSLEIRLVNPGNIPIVSFYSEDDDGIQIKLLDENNNVLFIGFLVQDFGYELLVNFQHPITLLANDSLGLLKGVILSDAYLKIPFDVNVRTNGPLDQILISSNSTAFNPIHGQIVEVLGVEYTILLVSQVPITIGGHLYNYTLFLTTSVASAIPATDTTIFLTGHLDLFKRNSLLAIIGACLYSTDLPLITNIYCGILETNNNPTKSAFEQILIDSQAFIQGEVFDDCYKVLEKILYAYRCTLFQANGQWNIVHWAELKMFPNGQIPGYQYDEHLIFLGGVTLNNNFNIGPTPQLTRPIFGLTEGMFRPYKFVRKQFDYVTPKYVILNYDLQKLGTLVSEYDQGGIHYSVYEFPDNTWTHLYGDTAHIVVQTNIISGAEITRYVYQNKINNGNTGYTAFANVQFNDIEVNQGDRFTFSINTKCASSIGGSFSVLYRFGFFLQTSTGQYYNLVDQVGPGSNELRWNELNVTPIQSVGNAQTVLAAQAQDYSYYAIQDQDYRGQVPPFPKDGILKIRIYGTTDTNGAQPNVDAIWKDVAIGIVYYVAESIRIIGQVHKDTQEPNKKANSDTTLYLDDSPKNAIKGTLCLTTTTGLIQKRTERWKYPSGTVDYRLGELNAIEELQWRSVTRSKLEGNFVGNIQNGNYMSLLCPCITTFNPTKVYVPGLLTMDYKRNQFYCTLWEITDSETPDVADTYTFTYIYDTK